MLISSINQVFFWITQVQTQTLNMHIYTYSPLWTYIRKPYLYENLQKIVLTYIKIDEVILDASLSMKTSLTTPRRNPLVLGQRPGWRGRVAWPAQPRPTQKDEWLCRAGPARSPPCCVLCSAAAASLHWVHVISKDEMTSPQKKDKRKKVIRKKSQELLMCVVVDTPSYTRTD